MRTLSRPLIVSLLITYVLILVALSMQVDSMVIDRFTTILGQTVMFSLIAMPVIWGYLSGMRFHWLILTTIVCGTIVWGTFFALNNYAVFTQLPAILGQGVLFTLIAAPVIWGYFVGMKLHWHILTAMACGAVFWGAGLALHSSTEFMQPLGTIFIRLLRMVIVPLVMSSIIVGVAGVSDAKNLGRLGLKTFAYYTLTSLMAIIVGLMLTNLIRPGVGVEIPMTETYTSESLEKPGSVFDIVIRMIPINPVAAASEGDMLGIIFFSLFFGFAMARISAAHRDKVLPLVNSFFHIMMRVTEEIIRLAPIGVIGLIVTAFNRTVDPTQEDPLSLFRAVGMYFGTIGIGLTIHILVVLPIIYYLFTKRSPAKLFGQMASALTTAFSTSSSSATLPVTMECIENNVGVSNKISSFVLPMGATINMDGTALYECAGVLFIAQVLGIDLSITQQLVVVITALLASIGAAGIPSAGLVMIFIVLDAVGIEGEMVGVIVGTMLAIDRPLDMYRTAVNVFSDSVGTAVIAHSEGEITEPS